MTIQDDLDKRLAAILAPEGICVYQASPAEQVLLLRWYVKLVRENELRAIFPDEPDADAFLRVFAPPNRLLYTLDAAFNLTHAGWFVPFARGAIFALWFDSTLRGSRRQRSILLAGCDYALSIYDVIFVSSKQPRVIELAEHFGFARMSPDVPYLYEPTPHTFCFATRDTIKPPRKEA